MNKNIRCIVIKQFTLQKFGELENLKRYNSNLSKDGELYVNDEFSCTKEMADYLTGNNAFKKEVVKVIEVKPENKNPIELDEENVEVVAEVVKKTTKKTAKKKKEK